MKQFGIDLVVTIARAAWVSCVAIVDMIFDCQHKDGQGCAAHD